MKCGKYEDFKFKILCIGVGIEGFNRLYTSVNNND